MVKTYKIYLRHGGSFIVKAHHYKPPTAPEEERIRFYKSETEEDTEIYVVNSEVAAIVPVISEDRPPRVRRSSAHS